MDYTIDHDTNTVTLTCTIEEIAMMEAGLYAAYATPTPAGVANQVYLSNRANFKYDFLLANADDFLEEEGIDTIDWNDMTLEEQDEVGRNTITIAVPATRSPERVALWT